MVGYPSNPVLGRGLSSDDCGSDLSHDWNPAMSLDFRDRTPEPPALLDPYWVLRMRARLRTYQETGSVDWMEVVQ